MPTEQVSASLPPDSTVRPRGGRSVGAAVLLAAGACTAGETVFEPSLCAMPEVVQSAVTRNANNALSAFVSVQVRSADSVAVRFGRSEESLESQTPTTLWTQDTLLLPVFGLHPESDYALHVLAFNRCGIAAGERLAFRTEALPAGLPGYFAGGSDPSPGYVAFAAANYGLVIDNAGRVVWYHFFPDGVGLSFQPQPNGRYVARPNPSAGEAARWVEVDALGNITRMLGCARGLHARLHDLIAVADGSYWVLCDEVRTVDLSAVGYSSSARVQGTVVQHVSATGHLLFEWSPFDHFEVDLRILEPADLSGASINWTHGNALDLDGDGNLLVSFRNLNEITKIDPRSGAVLWRMGGARNEFDFENAGAPPFARQHGVRAISEGSILLLDNLGESGASRAERFEIDEAAGTVRLSDWYTSSAGAVAQLGGSVQGLSGGHTLVSFGNGASVEEYDSAGNVVWRILGNPGYVFRAQRIRSLYKPGIGDPR
jgi:hypothetical protein